MELELGRFEGTLRVFVRGGVALFGGVDRTVICLTVPDLACTQCTYPMMSLLELSGTSSLHRSDPCPRELHRAIHLHLCDSSRERPKDK